MNINMNNVMNDIDLERACAAWHGVSFSPERRGASFIEGYVYALTQLALFIEKNAKDERQQAVAQEVFDSLRAKYLEKTLAHLNAQSRCVSTMIAGPSNFPVNRAEKANESERKHSAARYDFENKMQDYALKSLNRVYSTAEKQQTELDDMRLKLERAKVSQQIMKDVNVICRKKGEKEFKKEQIVLLGLTDSEAEEILTPDYMGAIGFAHYSLSNNNANIKRMEQRVKDLEYKSQKAKEAPKAGDSLQLKGLEVTQNYEEDRLQLVFDGKPDEATRSVLKANGFRWSPRFTAWQRKLTGNAIYAFNRRVLPSEAFQQYKEKSAC